MKTSIVIPMYNAAGTILGTLEGLERQSSNNFEVIVVDDGSRDNSPSMVEGFRRRSTIPVKMVRQDNAGPARARNRGIEHASGEIVAFLDSDCVTPDNWVEDMTTPIKGDVIGCHCGYRVRNDESLIARYIDYEIARRHEKMLGKNIDTFGSYSASFLKSFLVEMGGFSTEFSAADAEDFDLGFKMKKAGLKVYFTGDTFVYHHHPASLRRYLRQQQSRGYWRVKLYLRNRDKFIGGDDYTGYEAQSQFLLANLALVSVPLALVSPFITLAGCGLLLLSNLPLGLWTFRREKKLLFIAPVLASLRSLAGTFGVYKYIIQNIRGLFRELSRAWGHR